MLSLLKLALILGAFIAVIVGSVLVSLSHRVIEDAKHRQVINHQIKDSHEMRNWRLR